MVPRSPSQVFSCISTIVLDVNLRIIFQQELDQCLVAHDGCYRQGRCSWEGGKLPSICRGLEAEHCGMNSRSKALPEHSARRLRLNVHIRPKCQQQLRGFASMWICTTEGRHSMEW